MSDFLFKEEDFADGNTFLVAAAEKQTNTNRAGQPMPLKTTTSQSAPKKTLTIFSIADAAMNAPLMKPQEVSSDIFNRVGQDVIAHGIADNGGTQVVLGGYSAIAPQDMIIKANALPTTMPDYGNYSGGGGTAVPVGGNIVDYSGVNMSDWPRPSGEFRTYTLMYQIYGLNGTTTPPPSGSPMLTTFTWYNGTSKSVVHKATVPVWTLVDRVFAKYNYEIRSSGAHYVRNTAGGVPSLHSYGIAVDINPAENPHAYGGRTDMPVSMVQEIQQIKTVSGLSAVRWGGTYKKPDTMHYEVMVSPKEISEGLTMGGGSTSNIGAAAR